MCNLQPGSARCWSQPPKLEHMPISGGGSTSGGQWHEKPWSNNRVPRWRTMSGDLWSPQNQACPPGDPKEGSLLHPGSWQRLETMFTCKCTPEQSGVNHFESKHTAQR